MDKENRLDQMKITYLGNCKLFSRLNDILEASNWCLSMPTEHAKGSGWLDGQLVQKATTDTELQVEVHVLQGFQSTIQCQLRVSEPTVHPII